LISPFNFRFFVSKMIAFTSLYDFSKKLFANFSEFLQKNENCFKNAFFCAFFSKGHIYTCDP